MECLDCNFMFVWHDDFTKNPEEVDVFDHKVFQEPLGEV